MSILVEASSRTAIGDGVNGTFATGFKFLDNVHITVTVNGVIQVEGNDYDLNGAGSDDGGDVLFLSGVEPAVGAVVYIERNTPILQEVDLRPNGLYEPDTIEGMADRLTMIAQENRRRIAALEGGSVLPVTATTQIVTVTFTPLADPLESNFPVNVACTGTPIGVELLRVEDLTDGSNVHYGLGSPDWVAPILNRFSLMYVPGLTPRHNYRLKFLVVVS